MILFTLAHLPSVHVNAASSVRAMQTTGISRINSESKFLEHAMFKQLNLSAHTVLGEMVSVAMRQFSTKMLLVFFFSEIKENNWTQQKKNKFYAVICVHFAFRIYTLDNCAHDNLDNFQLVNNQTQLLTSNHLLICIFPLLK